MNPGLTILECTKTLNFAPLKKWDVRLPAFAWKSILLCGFDLPSNHPVIEVSDLNSDVVQAIAAVHPVLSFVEICRLLNTFPADPESTIADRLFLAYQYRPSQDLYAMRLIVTSMPLPLQEFVAEKMITPGELAPLRSLNPDKKSPNSIFATWSAVIDARASRQIAIKILELLIDLHVSASALTLPRRDQEVADQWLKRLQALRFPQVTQRDQLRAQALKEIPWPLKIQAQFERVGDETNLHLSLRAISSQDLKRKFEELGELYRTSAEQMERSWNPPSLNK